MQRLWLVAAGVLVAISGLTATAPPVVTRLRARFSAPPLALELAEAVAAENTTAYFSFLTHVASIGLTDTPESAVYQHALQYVRDEHVFGSPAAVALWEWGMALHTAAPAVEAYYQYYTDTVVPDLNATLPAFDSACPVWVLFNQRQYCGEDAVRQAFPTSPRDNPAHEPKDGQLMIQVSPKRLPFDHIYSASGVGPVTDAAGPTAILYADIAHPAFLPVHQLLLQFATTQPATYIFRPRPPTTSSPQPLYLSGYGVSLRLKSTEYRVIDDEAHQPSTPSQTLAPSDELLQQPAHPVDEASLNEAVPTVNALTKQQIRTLGLLSAQWVLNHTDTLQPQSHALDALAHLTQDFPKYAHRLVLRTFNESLADGVFVLRSSRMQPGIWLNGLPLRHSTIKPLEAFGLLASLRAETQVIDGLLAAGLPLATVHQLLVAPDLNRDPGAYQQHMPTSSKLNDLTRHRVDPFASVVQNEYQVYDVRPSSGQESTVVWWNDLERDAVYSHWPGLGALRRSLYSGGMRRIGKNICSVVFFLDLSSHQGLEILVEDVAVNVMQQVPLRFGIAPLVAPEDAADSSPPTTMAQLFYFITNAYSRAQAVEFFKAILTQKRLEPNTSIVAIARAQFAQWLTLVPLTTDAFNTPKSVVDPWDRMLHTARTMYQDYLEELRRLQERLNLPSPTGHTDGVGFANGKYFDLNDGFRRHVMTIYSLDSVFVTQKYLDGEITDDTNLYDYFLTQATVLMHRNALIFPSATRPLSIRNMVAALDASDEQWVDQVPYLYPLGSTRASPKPVARPWISVWVVGDLSQPMVQADFNEALRHMQADSSVRVAWIPNAFFSQRRQSTTALADSYYEQLLARAAHVSRQLYTDHVWPMVAALSPQASNTTTEAPAPADDSVFSATQYFYPLLSAMLADPAADFTQLVQKVTAQTASEQASPASGHGSHLERLFQQLRGHGDPVDATHVSRVYARIARCSQHALQLHDTDRTLVINARSLGALHESQRMTAQDLAVLVSLEVTKRVGPLFSALQASGVPLMAASTLLEHDQLANQLLKVGSIVFSAGTAHATYPLAEAARVVRTSLTELHAAPDLPAEPLLTLALDTLSSWMVTPIASDHDLDNLRLATAAADGPARAIEAMFELKHIMVEGHCVDVTTGYPPRGLQFVLGTAATPALTDTVVMANYGYFQFLAGSGVWNLQLRTGRSQQLYTLENAGNQGWPGEALRDVPTQVVVTSLQGVTIYPKVRKRPGHENESLLVSNQPVSDHQDAQPFALRAPSALFGPHSFWSMAARWVTEQAAQVIPGLQLPVAAQETIHVFSVASGHLYERFLGIMILSVLEHTRHPVKFWFIENFLSPSFKAFIPHMAQHYGFTYQLVTYQWPYWLRQQTEKQRTIWGYKILFLDVLFPLSVDKIIFVDADQVVRADLGELATMDLQGAPYGYVPFCNNRPEMDGFRFWKGGWWQQHLAGKPYHISALYVVDLHRFRQLAAGDRLRQQYQALSQDPNSLANLDQDLPNNMQHDVPIFSLPQEWLWCETWCSDSSLQSAKTIDLCNNPLTKEPKLQRARRLLPEWEKYDQAIQAFKQQLSTTAASPVAVSTTAVPDAGALDHAHEEL
ncbi:killer toxin resistant protein [Dimargaris verticillata]|uniref:Killer toxin resistant protein n=1 Tax=Dimargaris verticillata TaxID=2761393 RepID=A0A9W8B3N1_9FUNG|nr:killer toxin resistant protein [Dimargaris verticillata]